MWIRDVKSESTPLDTTGGHTWKAAYRLADFLEAMAAQLGLDAPGAAILELGSGTGWLGLTVSRNLPSASLVCLTEQADGRAWLQHNLDTNLATGLPLNNVIVQTCDWTHFCHPEPPPHRQPTSPAPAHTPDPPLIEARPVGVHRPTQHSTVQRSVQPRASTATPEAGVGPRGAMCHQGGLGGGVPAGEGSGQVACLDLAAVQWDFILGSDLIYNQVGSRCLPRVLRALCGPATVMLYCHTKHRYDLLDWEFMQQLEEVGLEWEEVWEAGAQPPPPSPPPVFPPEDLFPQQRIVVYRIVLRQ